MSVSSLLFLPKVGKEILERELKSALIASLSIGCFCLFFHVFLLNCGNGTYDFMLLFFSPKIRA